MIIKRLLTLQAVLLLGLGSVFLLPHHAGLGPAGIAMELPRTVPGGWRGDDAPVDPKELAGLAPDTGFVRKFYNRGNDQIYVSIVLSGEDMSNSIHRPERCLAAQGWTVERSSKVQVKPAEGDGAPLTFTQLSDVRDARTQDGKTFPVRNYSCYWFIGSEDNTASHWTRTFIDARDRVLHGRNQRWAYVTVATLITDNLRPGGKNAEATQKMLQDFISEILPQFKKPDGKPVDAPRPQA